MNLLEPDGISRLFAIGLEMIPAQLAIKARRNTPFIREWTFTDADGEPIDFTGAVVEMQVRLYGAQPGDSLIDLNEVTEDQAEGLMVEDGSIRCWIDQSTLMFLPSGKPGSDVVFVYDLTVKQPDIVEEIWQYGTFTVTPGVTDRMIFLTNETAAYLLTEDGAYLIGA